MYDDHESTTATSSSALLARYKRFSTGALFSSVLLPLAWRCSTKKAAQQPGETLPDTQLIKHTHTMGHGVDSEAAGWVTDYMVITNNYRKRTWSE